MTFTALSLAAALAFGADTADAHVIAGADAFRRGDLNEALVEFRVAEKRGSGEAQWYVAATLAKLRRAEEALDAFGAAQDLAPTHRDALFDYYLAVACVDAKLYGRADDVLATVGDRAGPRVAAQVRKLRGELAAVLAPVPSPTTIDWYRTRAAAWRQAARPRLVRVYLEEGRRLAGRRKDCYGCAEIQAEIDRDRAGAGRAAGR